MNLKRTIISGLALGALAAPLAITEPADARTLQATHSNRCYEDGSCVYRTFLTIDRQQNPLRDSKSIVSNLVYQHVGPDAMISTIRVLKREPLRIRATGVIAGVEDSKFIAIFTRAGRNFHPRSYGYVTKIAIQGSYCRADALCERN